MTNLPWLEVCLARWAFSDDPESFAGELELGLGSLRHEIRGHDGSDCRLSTSRNAIGPMAPQTVFLNRLRPLARVQVEAAERS